MRIIDILNLIANKEYDKLPKKIEYDGYIYKFNLNDEDYYNNVGGALLREYLEPVIDYLNEEVKIIVDISIKWKKEEHNIKELNYKEHIGIDLSEAVCNKLNEVIRKINEMNKGNKEV